MKFRFFLYLIFFSFFSYSAENPKKLYGIEFPDVLSIHTYVSMMLNSKIIPWQISDKAADLLMEGCVDLETLGSRSKFAIRSIIKNEDLEKTVENTLEKHDLHEFPCLVDQWIGAQEDENRSQVHIFYGMVYMHHYALCVSNDLETEEKKELDE